MVRLAVERSCVVAAGSIAVRRTYVCIDNHLACAMVPAVAGFDWDAGNRAKCAEHGVPLADIEALPRGNPHVAPDVRHSRLDDRLIAVDWNATGRAMFVAIAVRTRMGRRLIHPIMARSHACEGDQGL